MKDLEAALKSLKKDKARDPLGRINEIFKDEVAGHNLKLSLLHMFNNMKKTRLITMRSKPDYVEAVLS